MFDAHTSVSTIAWTHEQYCHQTSLGQIVLNLCGPLLLESFEGHIVREHRLPYNTQSIDY
jgi:hypothetical protein